MAVSDRRRLAPGARRTREEAAALVEWIVLAVAAGVDLVQVRERDLAPRALLDVSREAARASVSTTTRVVVNDRADIAAVATIDGVHLTSSSLEASRLRSVWPGWLLGRSVHEGDAFESETSADYLVYGSVFETSSKPASRATGVDSLKRAVANARIPVLAIGGITPARAAAAIQTGAAGIAAIGLFLPEGRAPGALGLRAAVRELRAVLPRAASDR
jgi:thiamine-phosphate diphosphorylase